MRLDVKRVGGNNVHSDLVAAVGWNSRNELFSCGDDKQIARWDVHGESGGKVCDLESFVTAMAWSPTSGKDQSSSSETFATGGSDGVVRFVRCNGRVDKTLDAHRGAVTSTRWTNCGGFLLTSGEDGVVKTWSRSGNLHATLAVGDAAVYACAWSPRAAVFGGDGAVVFGRGNNLRIVSTADVGSKEQSAAKKNVPGNEVKAWKAHDGVVLSIDWCPALDGRIVSGGEDRRYKVWDGHGQILFISPARDHVITAVRWSPTGQHFAAGSFDSVWLCARDGWTNGSNDTGVGSAVSLAWARDGSSVAGCGGKPPFVFTGAVVDVEHLWDDIVVSRCGVTKLCEVTIHNFRNERSALDTVDDGVSTYTLKTGTERVSRLSWRHGILLVVSPKQICLHKSGAWQTPVATVDVSDCVVFIDQSRTGFAFVTATSDVVHVYTYDGQKVCDLRSDGLFPQSLDENVFSKSPDCVTFVDRSAGGDSMTCVDLSHSSSNGKQSGDGSGYKIPHSAKIQAVKLNQVGDASSGFRILAFLDSNKDLWLKRVEFAGTAAGGGHASSCVKIKSMVDCFAWSEKCDALVAVSRSQIVAWRCPVVFFTDNDLVGLTTTSKDLVGHGVGNAQTKGMLTITRFDGARVTVQNDDGARVTTSLCANSAFFPQLHNHAVGEKGTAKQWDKAIRLCRFAKDSTLWATLATHAMNVNELETAEIAYAALEQIEKVRFLQTVRKLEREPVRAAQLALFKHQVHEAERILVHGGFLFRAIEMHLRLFDWDKALQLALEHRTHVDTVLHFRNEYLEKSTEGGTGGARREDKPAFIAARREVEVSATQVLLKIAQERTREASHGNSDAAKPTRKADAEKSAKSLSSKTEKARASSRKT